MNAISRLLVVALCATPGLQINSPAKGPDRHTAQVTLTGCLSGPNHEGVYVLETGLEVVDVGGLTELNNHVGHKVKLIGQWAKNGAEIGEKDPSENKETEQQDREEDAKEKWFKVRKIQVLSRTCSPK